MMILGIDVGGTHTDAVLIENFKVKKKAKVHTDEKNLMDSLSQVTAELLKEEDIKGLERVVLSTTISTNAIVQNKTESVSLILASGPGLSPSYLKFHDDTYFISGYVNHRGIEIDCVDQEEVRQIGKIIGTNGNQHVGIVGKFSTRNPVQELKIKDIIGNNVKHVSLGHRMSGQLNFPRRISTTYLNAAIWNVYHNFFKEVINFANHWNITAPIYILKADGGTIDITQSVEIPVQTILSGPAASIMGILCMYDHKEDAIALDIGGTTTDIAIFAEGVPLLEAFGVTIGGRKTLIRGLRTKSIGVGGDSRVKFEHNKIVIGPEREGPAAAFGGPFPTPTDVLIILGMTAIGNKEKAVSAVKPIAQKMNCSVMEAAAIIFDRTCREIADHVKIMIKEINNTPVYTIHEMLEGRKLHPKVLYAVGGPAQSMAESLGKLLDCPAYIPEHAEVANAIGAALARTTVEMTVLADTERRALILGEEGIQMTITPQFSKEDAIKIAKEKLQEKAIKMGAKEDLEIEVIEDQEFNMVRGFGMSGKNIRIKVQIKPGLITGYKRGSMI